MTSQMCVCVYKSFVVFVLCCAHISYSSVHLSLSRSVSCCSILLFVECGKLLWCERWSAFEHLGILPMLNTALTSVIILMPDLIWLLSLPKPIFIFASVFSSSSSFLHLSSLHPNHTHIFHTTLSACMRMSPFPSIFIVAVSSCYVFVFFWKT